MQRRFVPILLSIAVALVTACSSTTNIMDLQTPFSTSSANATLNSVGRTIITASAFKGWHVQSQSPGQIIASRHHSGHVAKVKITYTTDSFSISYLDSDNLGYNTGSISSIYAEWVEDLRDEIRSRLSDL